MFVLFVIKVVFMRNIIYVLNFYEYLGKVLFKRLRVGILWLLEYFEWIFNIFLYVFLWFNYLFFWGEICEWGKNGFF